MVESVRREVVESVGQPARARLAANTPRFFHTFRLHQRSTIEPAEPTNRPQTLSRLKPPTTSPLIRRELDLLQFLRMGTCSDPLAVVT